VFSLSKARCGKKIFELVRQYPDHQFNLYQILNTETNTNTGFQIMLEPNVTQGQYGAEEFKDNYLGTILNLWQHRRGQPIICVANDE